MNFQGWVQSLLSQGASSAQGDPLSPLYYLVGSMVVLQLGASIVGAVRWLGARTVEREDRDKEDLREQLKEHDDHFLKLERALSDLERIILLLQSEGKQSSSAIESTRGAVGEIKNHLETRFEKQAEYYRGQLKESLAASADQLGKLEYTIRQDMARAIYDAGTLRRSAKPNRG